MNICVKDMALKKENDLELPRLPPQKGDGILFRLFKQKIKKIEIPETEEEPDLLRRIDFGEKEKNIEPEFYLWLCDGRVIKDLKEFTQVIRYMKEDVFKFHVREYSNDFSNWVRDVIGNEKLAEELSKAKTREESYAVLTGKKVEHKKIQHKKREARKESIKDVEAPELPKIEGKEKIEENKNETEYDKELSGLKAEEEVLNKIGEAIKKPEPLLTYEGKTFKEQNKKKETATKAVIEEKTGEIKKGINRRTTRKEAITGSKEKPKKTKQADFEKINKLLDDALNSYNQGNAESTKELTKKARVMLSRASIAKENKRELKYRLVDIETKAKLFMLSQ